MEPLNKLFIGEQIKTDIKIFSEMSTKAQGLKDLIDIVMCQLINRQKRIICWKQQRQKTKRTKYLSNIENYEYNFEHSVKRPVEFLLFLKKTFPSKIKCTPHVSQHSLLNLTEGNKMGGLVKLLNEMQIIETTRYTGAERLLKMIPTLEFNKLVTVAAVSEIYHISCLTSDRFWVTDWYNNNLILTNTAGETLYQLTDCVHNTFNLLSYGVHTVNVSGDLIYIDKENNIYKLSTEKKTNSRLITDTKMWKPFCVFSSPLNGDLLVGMYNTDTNKSKVIRYNDNGKFIQIIQHSSTGMELFNSPSYITENHNGDIAVSDVGAVVVTDGAGRYRFSYSGPPAQKRLTPRGICSDVLSHILVCDEYTSSVQMIDKDGNFLSHIQRHQLNITAPFSLSYDKKSNLLWIGSLTNNKVSVFEYAEMQTLPTGQIHGDQKHQYWDQRTKRTEDSLSIGETSHWSSEREIHGDQKYRFWDQRTKRTQHSLGETSHWSSKHPFILAIDIDEKYYGLAHTDLSNPQVIIPSHPMERIAVLIEKPDKIIKVGVEATNEFLKMKADDLHNHVYVNEIKSDKLWKEVPGTKLQFIELFTAATLGVIKRIEKEICKKMKDIKDVRVVFSARLHWQHPVKDLITHFLKTAWASSNWIIGQEKVAFIEKDKTVSQFIREAEAATYCLNFNIHNLNMKSKYYAVLNVGFGSCHLSFLHCRDKKHFDKREGGGIVQRDWEEALPEDQVWALCREILQENYITQQNHVRVIDQYENLHERIKFCRDYEETFEFSFPNDIFKKNFMTIAKKKGIEIQEKNKRIIIMLKWYLLKTFFIELNEAVNGVIEMYKHDFERLKIKCVFLMGGYSIMKMIQDAARNEWFKNMTIVIPEDGGVSYAVGGAAAGVKGFIKFDAT